MASSFLPRDFAAVSFPEFYIDPQPARELQSDGWLGISNGLVKALNTLSLHGLAQGMTILRDVGMVGDFQRKSKLMKILQDHRLGYYTSLEIYRMFLTGKPQNRHKVKEENQNKHILRDTFIEYVVKSSPIFNTYNISQGKISQLILEQTTKKGRGKPEGIVYIPTEEQMISVLLRMVVDMRVLREGNRDPSVAEDIAYIKSCLTSGEIYQYEPRKPFSLMGNKGAFAGFFGIGSHKELWQHIDNVPAGDIAKAAGVCRKTSRKYLKEDLKANIVPNRLITRLIWKQGDVDPERVAATFPTEEELKERVAAGLVPSSSHLRDAMGEAGQWAPLTKDGFLALVNTGTSKIYYTVYPMNCYNLTLSPFNPYPKEQREMVPFGKEMEAIGKRKKGKIKDKQWPEEEGQKAASDVQCAYLDKHFKPCTQMALSGEAYCSTHMKKIEKQRIKNGEHQVQETIEAPVPDFLQPWVKEGTVSMSHSEAKHEPDLNLVRYGPKKNPIRDRLGLRKIPGVKSADDLGFEMRA